MDDTTENKPSIAARIAEQNEQTARAAAESGPAKPIDEPTHVEPTPDLDARINARHDEEHDEEHEDAPAKDEDHALRTANAEAIAKAPEPTPVEDPQPALTSVDNATNVAGASNAARVIEPRHDETVITRVHDGAGADAVVAPVATGGNALVTDPVQSGPAQQTTHDEPEKVLRDPNARVHAEPNPIAQRDTTDATLAQFNTAASQDPDPRLHADATAVDKSQRPVTQATLVEGGEQLEPDDHTTRAEAAKRARVEADGEPEIAPEPMDEDGFATDDAGNPVYVGMPTNAGATPGTLSTEPENGDWIHASNGILDALPNDPVQHAPVPRVDHGGY